MQEKNIRQQKYACSLKCSLAGKSFAFVSQMEYFRKGKRLKIYA
uniref:Uncharacterized protein n=1 Tax=Arundo donax TaxID=35708 RepID=A0A0A8YWF4_ARUDO